MAKKRINGKKKGNKGEREVAAHFTKWVGLKFNRVPASGGLHWKSDNRVHGDIVPPVDLKNFPFCIEVKNTKEISFNEMLQINSKTSAIKKFWKQCVDDASEVGLEPLLAFHYNGLPKKWYFCMLRRKVFLKLKPHMKTDVYKLLYWNGKIIFPLEYLMQIDYKTVEKLVGGK